MNTLVKYYKNGYRDEKFGTSSIQSDNIREQLAYKLGVKHAINGTDPTYIEELPNDRIMEEIER
jgi:hypothetical protein